MPQAQASPAQPIPSRIVRPLDARAAKKPATSVVPPNASQPRAFTLADKSLIARMKSIVPAAELLNILNTRLASDLGGSAKPYTMAMLTAEIGDTGLRLAGTSWAVLRKHLVKARTDGVLDRVTEQCIDDFAVVYQLNPKQVTALKDIVLAAAKEA